MHLAAAQHSLRGISLLLANGASVNATDNRGRTPLHVACEKLCHDGCGGDGVSDAALLECIELLLSSGAREDARDANGQTALHLSVLAGNLRAARALLAAGATVVADDAGNSPLHLAAAQGHSDIIQLLVVGKRGESLQQPNAPASTFSEVETRAQSRPPVAVGELHQSVFDECISARESGPGTDSVRRQKGAPTTSNGQTFGDDDVATRSAAAPGQRSGALEMISNVSGDPAEGRISNREAHSRYPEPGVASLEDRPTDSVCIDSWGGPSALNSVSKEQNDPLGQRDAHENDRLVWQGQTISHDVSVEKSFRSADTSRISEEDAGGRHGHRAAETEHHRRRRPRGSGSRLSRRHHESARDDNTLGWPEALPSDEYVQVSGLELSLCMTRQVE